MTTTNYSRLTISSRLFAGFGGLVLLTLLMGGMALFSITDLSALMVKFTNHPFQVTDHAQRLKSNILEMDRDMGLLLHAEDLPSKAVYNSQIRNLDQSINDNLAIIKQYYLGPREDIYRLISSLEDLRASRDKAITLSQLGREEEAIASFLHNQDSPDVKTEEYVQTILDFARNKAASLRLESEQHRQRSFIIIAATMVVLLLVGVISSRFISLSITRSLELLRARMAVLADGDLTAEVPYLNVENELSAMAKTVQIFKESAIKLEKQNWVKSQLAELNHLMQTSASMHEFALVVMDNLTPLCGGSVGIFYLADDAGEM